VSEVNYSLADYLSDVTALKAERDAAVRERDEAFQQLEEHGRYRLKAAHWKREYDRLAAIVERVKALRAKWNLDLMRSEREEFDRALAPPVDDRMFARNGVGFVRDERKGERRTDYNIHVGRPARHDRRDQDRRNQNQCAQSDRRRAGSGK
jgi:hypothetical protein